VAFSLKSHFSFFRVKNKAGVFQLPGARAIKAAAATVTRVPADNKLSIVDPPKSQPLAYPICTFTYVILPTKTENAAALRKYVFWALTGGAKYGPKLLFEPVPKVVLSASEKTLKKVQS
jgi:ABC-type phosphate transport system substrate-binding protein